MQKKLIDSFRREITDIRISLTNRCNLNCFYCHNEGLGKKQKPMSPQEDEMNIKKIFQISKIAYEFGIKNYKLTGGEPMLRKDLDDIINKITTIGDIEVSITTNGVFLDKRAQKLKDAGLDRVNISMDTCNPENFRKITNGGIKKVYEGIDSALKAELTPIKLNMVMAEPMQPFLDEMIEFVSKRDGLHLQIIEYMPEIVGDSHLQVDIDEIKKILDQRSDNKRKRKIHNRDQFIIDNTIIEVVDPVENPNFCANCNRIRITHDGKLKSCLNRNDDLIPTDETDDEELRSKFTELASKRVPYYGEYMIKNEKGEWMKNPEYIDNSLLELK